MKTVRVETDINATAEAVRVEPRAASFHKRPLTADRGRRSVGERLAWAVLGCALVTLAIVVGGWTWWLLALALAPDLPLFFGAGNDLVKGQLHPRAVNAYNATHSLIGPAAVITFGLVIALMGADKGFLVVGLVWGMHVSLDRVMGYGLRTREGFQR